MATNDMIRKRQATMQQRSQSAKTPVLDPDAQVDAVNVPAKAPQKPVQPQTPAPFVSGNTPQIAEAVGASTAGRSIALPQVDETRTMGSDDVIMPKLKLSQAMSKVNSDDVVRQGNWYHSTTNQNLGKEVYIIPVDMRKSRSFFVSGEGIQCRSFDMIQGEGSPGIECEGSFDERHDLPANDRGCPLRLWDKDEETGRRIPPKCGINYNYPVIICTDPDDLAEGRTMRAILSFRSTSISAARLINTVVSESDTRWYENVFRLGVEVKSNARGTFFVPTIDYVGESSGSALEKAKNFASLATPGSVRSSLEVDDTE